MDKMVQCIFKKGNVEQTAWVDKKQGLKIGSKVELKSETEGNEKEWEVIEMGKEMDSNYVHEHSRDYTRTRQASDI
jgi:transcription elongation GreA/GreB family factor